MAGEFRGKIQPHTHSEIEKSPYPPSPVIQSVEWDWSADRHAEVGKGSDLWPVTWAADDNLYTAWGDGGGFGGDNTVGRVWLGFGRMEGMPPDFRGTKQLGIFDAPNPWGPWTTVAYYSDWGGYQSGEGAYALGWDFPTKWMSEDGKTMWCVYSGSDRGGTLPDGARILDRFHIAKATLKLRKPR